MYVLICDSCVMPPIRTEIDAEEALRVAATWLESGDDAKATFRSGELESAYWFEGGSYDLEHSLFKVS